MVNRNLFNLITNNFLSFSLPIITTSSPQMDDNRQEQTYDGPAGMNPDGIIESNYSESYDNFDQMGLREELLRGIYAYGFEKPSAIQQRAIVPCVKGSDVIAQAQSGKCCWLPRFGESLPARRE